MHTLDLAIIAAVFPVIFIGELPDKSMFASLVMAQRYPCPPANTLQAWREGRHTVTSRGMNCFVKCPLCKPISGFLMEGSSRST